MTDDRMIASVDDYITQCCNCHGSLVDFICLSGLKLVKVSGTPFMGQKSSIVCDGPLRAYFMISIECMGFNFFQNNYTR